MAGSIHPTAIVEPGAKLGEGVEVGPYAIIGPEVTVGDRTVVKAHAVLTGWTEIGPDCVIFPHATLGEIPQDLKFGGEKTRLIVGARNRIREFATMHCGTSGGGGVTRIGDDNLFQTYSHVGHDVQIGSRIVLGSHSGFAGHCRVEDDVIIGGLTGIHQYVRIGRGAIVGGMTPVASDVIPFGLVAGPRGELEGLNLVGMKRRGMERGAINALRHAYDALASGEGSFLDRARRLAEAPESPEVAEVLAFILGESQRNFLTPK